MYQVLIAVCIVCSLSVARADYQVNDSDTATVNMGMIAKRLQLGQYRVAIDELWRLQRTDENNADVYNLLGFSHRKLGFYQKSLKYYQHALRLAPNHLAANEYLGELYLVMGDQAAAAQQLRKLAELCGVDCREYRLLEAAFSADLTELAP